MKLIHAHLYVGSISNRAYASSEYCQRNHVIWSTENSIVNMLKLIHVDLRMLRIPTILFLLVEYPGVFNKIIKMMNCHIVVPKHIVKWRFIHSATIILLHRQDLNRVGKFSAEV